MTLKEQIAELAKDHYRSLPGNYKERKAYEAHAKSIIEKLVLPHLQQRAESLNEKREGPYGAVIKELELAIKHFTL